MRLNEALASDRLKIIFVWVAFAAMAALGCWAAASAVGGDMRRNLEARFREADGNIRLNLRGPRSAFNNIHDALETMLSSGASPTEIEAHIESANSRLRDTAPGQAGIYGVYGTIEGRFYDPSGIFREPPEALAGKGWYQAAQKGEQLDYSGPYKDRKTGELVLSLARILYNQKGEYRGILCLNVGLNWLNLSSDNLAAADGGYGIIVNDSGTILSHPDRTMNGKSTSFLSPGERAVLDKAGPGIAGPFGPLENMDGGESRVYVQRLNNGWRAMAALPYRAGAVPVRRAVSVLGPVAAALAILCSIIIVRLSRARAEAELENKSKTTFLTRISHEIRTPMNAIVGMSDLLLRSEKDMSAQCRAWALNIKHAGDLLLSIINDILDFSAIRSGSFKFVPLSYTLSSLINDSINIIMVRLQEKSLVFLVFVDGKLPNYLRGDVTRVRQIILNILSNAVKYTREGYVYLLVKGKVRTGTNILELQISIRDTGIGIKPEDRDKLFSDFSRVDQQQNRNVEGTGLGLTITKSLCQMMDGTIDFESTYGLGSTFHVMVPQEIERSGPFAVVLEAASRKVLAALNRDDYAKSLAATIDNLEVRYVLCRTIDELVRELEDGPCDFTHVLIQSPVFQKEQARIERRLPTARVGVITDAPAGRGGKTFTYLQSPVYSLAVADFLNNTPFRIGRGQGRERRERMLIPKGRILVVDDLETNLQVASALLSEYGCRIDTSPSAAEALELVKRHRYDVVFMDHMMPNMDGVEATRIIRSMENGRHRDLPIIALTANAVSGMKDMFLNNGFNDFISKPIDLNALEEAIRRWVAPEKLTFVSEEELARQAAAAAAQEAREAELQAVRKAVPTAGAPQGDAQRPDGRAVPAQAEPPSGFTIPNARILVVDDLPTNVEVARALLAEYGCRVDAARGGAESLEMVQETNYDLVFMDHMMPGMDGIEAVSAIRALPEPRFKALPIVALTANIVPGVRETFLSSGFDDFIAKPIDISVLEAVLGRWISRDKMAYPDGSAPQPSPPEQQAPPEAGTSPPSYAAFRQGPPLDMVDFTEGQRKARGDAGYRRILGVFQKEAETWAETLRRDFPPAGPRDLQRIFQDMESSASIIGAAGLSALAERLETAARNEDLQTLEDGRYRCLAVLRNVIIRVDAYLAGSSAAYSVLAPPAFPAGEPAPEGGNAPVFGPAAFAAAAESLPPLHPGTPDASPEEPQSGAPGAPPSGPQGAEREAPPGGEAGAPEGGETEAAAGASPESASPEAASSGPGAGEAEASASGLEDDMPGTVARPEPRLPPDVSEVICSKAEVDFATGLERCRGAKDRYKKLLGFYLSDLESWLAIVRGIRDGGEVDLKDNTINFHAMKSASATVGAMMLSEEGAKLEAAGRREDAVYIRENAEMCLQLLECVRYKIESYIAEG
ncbi:MAG: response regulator [Deltaproteobacteria bacterium]|jgi:CheY-like chemotaxis protein|nr:response regulator [Deltaproteobacteria bacterium]